jgi:KaiC/GvpD/RAD55 family RecA-like ATPase
MTNNTQMIEKQQSIDIEKDIEYLVIALFFIKNTRMAVYFSSMERSFFYNPECAISFDILSNYLSEYMAFPSFKAFVAEARAKKVTNKFLVKLVNVHKYIDSEDLDYYYSKAKKYIRDKSIENAIIKSTEIISSDGNRDKIEDIIRKALYCVNEEDTGMLYYEDFEARISAIEETYSTGFSLWDKSLDGGLRSGNIIAVAGSTGVGKSIFLSNVAINQSLMGRDTLYITLELSETRTANRMDSFNLREKFDISKMDKLKEKLSSIKEYKLNGRNNLIIKRMPELITNVSHIKVYMDELKSKFNFVPKVVVIDYLDIMASITENKNDNDYTRQGRISAELRGMLALDKKVAILTATQLNRQAIEATEASPKHTADSMKKVFFLDASYQIIQSRVDKTKEIMYLEPTKNRFGSTGNKIAFNIKYEQMRLAEASHQPSSGD